jgi:GntR family transcriptional regulator, transcriptional repressor for pyruvate dehydrogenase complex
MELALSHFTLRDLVEVRCSVEMTAVALAARRATVELLAPLDAIVARMRDPATTMQDYNELDTSFHAGIAAASQNTLLHQLMLAFREAVRREMLASFERVEDWPGTAAKLTADHEAILQAIRDGDADGGQEAVSRHIRDFQARWLAGGEGEPLGS